MLENYSLAIVFWEWSWYVRRNNKDLDRSMIKERGYINAVFVMRASGCSRGFEKGAQQNSLLNLKKYSKSLNHDFLNF